MNLYYDMYAADWFREQSRFCLASYAMMCLLLIRLLGKQFLAVNNSICLRK
jgi:hypothetical protein